MGSSMVNVDAFRDISMHAIEEQRHTAGMETIVLQDSLATA